jgi:hypothetical protein
MTVPARQSRDPIPAVAVCDKWPEDDREGFEYFRAWVRVQEPAF